MAGSTDWSEGSDYVALPGGNTCKVSPITPSKTVQTISSRGGAGGCSGALSGGRDSGGDGSEEDSEMGHKNDLVSHGPSTAALPRRSIFIYGTGHVLNDLTAACWFSYLLIFLTDVGLSPKQAGGVMLSGQLADGVATILVGQLIDRFGQFKLWHGGGSFLVAISFSSVFGVCLACEVLGARSISGITIGYSVFAAIFNLGWAATQVSHMSLVNCITGNSSSRVSLNSCRNAFSMVANLCLYAIAYAVFWALPSTSPVEVQIQFKWIAWVAILVGSIFVGMFLLGVREPKLHHHGNSSFTRISMGTWFRRPLYYQVAFVYMLTRLTTNVSQAFLPFFVVHDLKMGESSKAVVPALIYISSFFISIVLQELHWTGHRLKGVFSGGACLWVISGAVMYLLPVSYKNSMYGVAGLVGMGNALMLVTATSLQGVLVGHDLSGCAFVYGSLSFLDKLACGVAIYVLERLNDETRPCRRSSGGEERSCSEGLIRLALGLVPSGCALLAVITTWSMNLEDSDSEAQALRKPFVPRLESESGEQVGGTSVRGKGSTLAVAARPIFLPRTGSTRRDRAPVGDVDDDMERSGSREEGSPFTFWKRLESAMVGRWGSIRRAPQPWLE